MSYLSSGFFSTFYPEIFSFLSAIIVSLIAAWLAQRSARRTREEDASVNQAKKDRQAEVDRDRLGLEAFKQAESSYGVALNTEHQRGNRLEVRLKDAEAAADHAEKRADELEVRVRKLENAVSVLVKELEKAGVPVPELDVL